MRIKVQVVFDLKITLHFLDTGVVIHRGAVQTSSEQSQLGLHFIHEQDLLLLFTSIIKILKLFRS
jgi:hypothetical protein